MRDYQEFSHLLCQVFLQALLCILTYYQWETNLHNMRTLQQYEIGSKDINKASGKTINSLALALHCNFYDVMELVL